MKLVKIKKGYIEKVADVIEAVEANALSANTLRAYRSDVGRFERFGDYSEETIKAYLFLMASNGRKYSTISRAAAAIGWAMNQRGLPPIDIRDYLRGLKRTMLNHDVNKVVSTGSPALMKLELRKVLARMRGGSKRLKRDRALILLGWAGAFRVSELVALTVDDVKLLENGEYLLKVSKSKNLALGEVQYKYIPYGSDKLLCPVSALQQLLQLVEEGPLFRYIDKGHKMRAQLTDRGARKVIKKRCGADFSPHSLRSGFVTESLRVSNYSQIMRQTGHKSPATVARYDKTVSVTDNNAVSKVL